MEFIFSLSINNYKVLAIFWNTILALAPCFVVYFMSVTLRLKKWKSVTTKERFAFLALFLFWLLMMPNTAYLFTIPRHLVNYCSLYDTNRVCLDGSLWLVLFFVTYSLIGLPTFYYSIKKMSLLFKSFFSRRLGLAVPVVAVPLTSVALLFGLLSRFNSWDVLTKPFELIRTAISYFLDATLFFNFFAFTVFLYMIYYGFDWFIHLRLNDIE